MSTDLLEVFRAASGVICCVGAGGKKTTLYRLAAEHPGRVGVTATSHIEYFPRRLPATKYIADEDALLGRVRDDRTSRVIAFAQPSPRRGRHAGITPDRVPEFRRAGAFDLLLVKSDGARSRLIKAPDAHEPPVPAAADVVIPVVSARVFGRRLNDRLAHRPEQLCAITGLQPGEKILPVHVARLLAAPDGALRNTHQAQVIPLINMVDDAEHEQLARAAAVQALGLTDRFDCVVLARMRDEKPIVDVVRR